MNKLRFLMLACLMSLGGMVAYGSLSGTAQAADCSANAVITCGVASIDQLRTAYNSDAPAGTQHIFGHFGLTSDVVNSAANKQGYVTKTGDVVVNGKVVATGAISAGRQSMPGSTQQSAGGTTFYTRPTSTSFLSPQLSAIVFFDEQGRFIAAVLLDCGNPVMATSTVVIPEKCALPGKEKYPKNDPRCVEDKPSVSIAKTVNSKEHATVAVGTTFAYQITVKNTGKVALNDVKLTDTAPTEITLISANDKGTISDNTWTHTLPELGAGASKTFTLTAKYEQYASGTHTNTVCVDTPTLPTTTGDTLCDNATTDTKEKFIVCDLTDNTVKTIDRSKYDEAHMTTDQTKCGTMKVCIIKTKTEKDIAKKEFDAATMTTVMSECDDTPVPELPKTGIKDALTGTLGMGSVVGASYAFMASRRSLR